MPIGWRRANRGFDRCRRAAAGGRLRERQGEDGGSKTRTVTDTVTSTTDEVEEKTTNRTTTAAPPGPTNCGNVSVDLARCEGGAAG